MSRKYTFRNPHHPIYQLKACEEKAYRAYRGLSRDELDSVCHHSGIPLRLNRTQKLEMIVASARRAFKDTWKNKIGWDFDDVYDDTKFQKHLTEDMEKAEKFKAEQNVIAK